MSPSSVYSRVIRIVAPRSSAPTRASRAAPLAAALVVGTVALLVGRVHVVETVPAPRTVRDETLADRALAAEPHAAILPRLNDNARPVDLRTTGGSWPAPSGARDEEEDYTTTPAAASIDSAPEPVAADPPLPIEVVELPAIVALAPSSEAWMAEGAPAVEPQSPAIWSVAAQAGKAVGAGSEQTALATARFFTRFGKSVARSF